MKIDESMKNGLYCSIDWLSFTVLDNVDLDTTIAEFGFTIEDFFECPRGANGYKKMLSMIGSNLRVLYDGADNMGIHFDVSGSAMSDFYEVYYKSCFNNETPFGELAIDMELDVVKSLFHRIQELGHITRLDLSIDNKTDIYYSVRQLHEQLSLGRFVSKWRTYKFIEEKETNGNCVGRTIYMGSRTSDIMLRVYDKELEQNKKYPDADDVNHVNYRWVRWELELKDDRANMVVNHILSGKTVGYIAVGILSNYLRLINLDDSNKSRCSSQSVWESFIDDVSCLRLYVSHDEKTLEMKKDWLIHQCAPTIAGIIMANHGDFSFLSECIDAHAMRMNKKLRELVTAVNPEWEKQLLAFQG
jgi:phage replication initiation protein